MNKMRLFTMFQGERHVFDVAVDQTVGEVKTLLRRKFDLDTVQSGEGENDMLMSLTYAGSSLNDEWIFADISIPPGATLRCVLQENVKSYLEVFCIYSGEIKRFTEPFDVWETKVADLKTMITNATGLHVSVFRLVTLDGKEMFDCHQLKNYGVTVGDTVRLETWNGWGEFLKAATTGQLTPTLKHMVSFNEDPLVAKYQLRVALFIAAHFGYHQLAAQLLKSGARSDEPVGEHPVREWCNSDVHPDYFKTPVHEAAQHGSLHCLRQFLHHNYACILAKDKSGLTPCNLARRYKQTECFKLLVAEQFRSRTLAGLNLSIYARVRKWCERARDRAATFHKHSPNPILLAMEKRSCRHAVVGQKVQVSGFGENQQTGRSKLMNSSLALTAKGIKFKTGESGYSNKIVKSTRPVKDQTNSVRMKEECEATDRRGTIENNPITTEENRDYSQKSEESKPETFEGVTHSLPAVHDSRFHREAPQAENWNINKAQMKIKSNPRKADKARVPRTGYRWKHITAVEGGKTSDCAWGITNIQTKSEVNERSERRRGSMPQLSSHNCLVCSDLQQARTNYAPKGTKLDRNKTENGAIFVTQSASLLDVGERNQADSELSEHENSKNNTEKIPPLRGTSLVALRTHKEDVSRKSDEDTKPYRLRVRSAENARRPSSFHKRAASEDSSLQSSSLYRMITGKDARESARESLDVAMTFNKKRWLQQVQMAVDLNTNTFKRQLTKFGESKSNFL